MLGFLLKQFFLEKNRLPRFGFFFLLGLFFSLFGIVVALLTQVWLLAVFVVALSVLPFLSQTVSLEQLVSERWKSSFAFFSELLEEYTAFFLGVFFSFLVFGVLGGTVFLPDFVGFGAMPIDAIQQVPPVDFLWSALLVNLGIFLGAFLLSFLLEFGASLVISWNAVFWGLLVAFRILQYQLLAASLLFSVFFVIATLPYLILDAVAYIAAAYAGLLLSRLVIYQKELLWVSDVLVGQSMRFLAIGLVSLALGALFETAVFHFVIPA